MQQAKTVLVGFCFFLLRQICVAQQPNDWENPQLVSLHTIPPHAFFIPYASEQEALAKKTSPFIQSLDGIWKFNLVQSPANRPLDFYKKSFDISQWKDIKVPSNWQTEGFDKFIFTDVEYPIPPNPPFVPADYNTVGSYKRTFFVPNAWKGKDVFIHLGAVNSFFYVWINEHYVGLSKDSKTPAEFNITPYLKKGTNTVSIQVFRFSDGTYLEGQDMWKLSGIERSVFLLARPKVSIYDFHVKAGLDENYENGIFDLKIVFNKKLSGGNTGQQVEIKLLDDVNGNKVIFQRKQGGNDNTRFQFSTIINEVRKWNAEQPNLYTVVINHINAAGKIIESINHKVGFRSVEIKNGLLLVNGVALKLKGVNRHEHNMYTAKVITEESMVNDIRLMKQYNINAVRCSHYPNAERWYELCDQYGLYVIDEPNIECDGMSFSPLNTLSDKPEWKAAYLDRTQRMFERDKNFSCIITWSLGNESRWGDNFIATYNYLKANDTRPVQYEEARDNPYTDIISPMYKSLHVMLEHVREWRSRPFIQVEYAHMMGNSGGNFKDDWDLIYKYDQLQGGFIWDFCDQTFRKQDKNGRWIWAYGRDMGNVGATSDTSFCADAMFAGDRTPHPQAYEVKKVYQNIHVEAINLSANGLRITNRFDFTNLDKFIFKWFIKADGKIIAEGSLDSINILPHQSKEIFFPIPAIEVQPATEYFLNIEAITKEEQPLVPKNYIIATEQFKLPWYKDKKIEAKTYPVLKHTEDAGELKIFNESFSVSFNKQTGWLQSFLYKGIPFLKESLLPHFWRGATDNDIGNSQQVRCAVWQHAADNAKLDSFLIKNNSAQQLEVITVFYLPDVDAKYRVQYLVHASGDVNVAVSMKAGHKQIPEMPRFGMRFVLNKNFENVTWLGRGPFDNYQDRNYASDIDLYSLKADSLFHPYPRAQESGYRTDVRWMALQNNTGIGLMAIGDQTISTGVLHFDMQKLDFNRDSTGNNHGGSMSNDDLIWWNIDYRQMGVGGDNSWGAKTHTEYLLPYRDYQYSFTLRPVSSGDLNNIAKEKQQ